MADRIAVMNKGVLQQVGDALEIYDRPATAFVADFIGSSNLLSGTLRLAGRKPWLRSATRASLSRPTAFPTVLGSPSRPAQRTWRSSAPRPRTRSSWTTHAS